MSSARLRLSWAPGPLRRLLLTYANGLTGAFTYDDKAIVRDNPRIHSPQRLDEIFETQYFGGPKGTGAAYRPVLLVSYAMQWWIHGGEVVAFHAVNVLWHAGVTLLLATPFSAPRDPASGRDGVGPSLRGPPDPRRGGHEHRGSRRNPGGRPRAGVDPPGDPICRRRQAAMARPRRVARTLPSGEPDQRARRSRRHSRFFAWPGWRKEAFSRAFTRRWGAGSHTTRAVGRASPGSSCCARRSSAAPSRATARESSSWRTRWPRSRRSIVWPTRARSSSATSDASSFRCAYRRTSRPGRSAS